MKSKVGELSFLKTFDLAAESNSTIADKVKLEIHKGKAEWSMHTTPLVLAYEYETDSEDLTAIYPAKHIWSLLKAFDPEIIAEFKNQKIAFGPNSTYEFPKFEREVPDWRKYARAAKDGETITLNNIDSFALAQKYAGKGPYAVVDLAFGKIVCGNGISAIIIQTEASPNINIGITSELADVLIDLKITEVNISSCKHNDTLGSFHAIKCGALNAFAPQPKNRLPNMADPNEAKKLYGYSHKVILKSGDLADALKRLMIVMPSDAGNTVGMLFKSNKIVLETETGNEVVGVEDMAPALVNTKIYMNCSEAIKHVTTILQISDKIEIWGDPNMNKMLVVRFQDPEANRIIIQKRIPESGNGK